MPRSLGFNQSIDESRLRFCRELGYQNSQISECSVPVATSSLGLSSGVCPRNSLGKFPKCPTLSRAELAAEILSLK